MATGAPTGRTPGDARPPRPQDSGPLVGADRLGSLGTLVAGLAHEINNPITYVIGNLRELRRLTEATRELIAVCRSGSGSDAAVALGAAEAKLEEAGGLELIDELIDDAEQGAARIRDLVRDLLNLYRASGGARTPVDVNRVLSSALRLVSRELKMRARLETRLETTRRLQGDAARLGQVFVNLLANAIDACREGPPERHCIRVSTFDTADGVAIEIEDSGRGIAEDDRARVFAPFFTTKQPGQGTGLGLYISQRIIEDHGGSIEVRPAASGGTAFTVRLPEQPPENRNVDA